MKKLIKFLCVLVILSNVLCNISVAQTATWPHSNTLMEKSYSVFDLKTGELQYNFQFWSSKEVLAVRFGNDKRVSLWEHWQHPTVSYSQLFLAERYKVEFSQAEQKAFRSLLEQLKQIFKQRQEKEILLSNLKLVSIEDVKGEEEEDKAAIEVKNWETFTAFDYADIGDNEADPVLSRLIHHGFKTEM